MDPISEFHYVIFKHSQLYTTATLLLTQLIKIFFWWSETSDFMPIVCTPQYPFQNQVCQFSTFY